MATASELRIGGYWEYDTSEGWVLTVLDIHDLVYFHEHPEKFNKEYRPIPLTPQVLRDAGCRQGTAINKEIWRSEHGLWLDSVGKDKCYIAGSNVGKTINYLHQLQVAELALTGKELIYKP